MEFGKKSIALLAIILTAIFGAYFFRYDIHDFVKLYGYTPSNEVSALADSTTMDANARRLFYVNDPKIADKQTFNEHCRENEYSIVLGCYLPGQRGIYLLDVDDERLDGIKEVTAAHELLHAAYERLSTSEKKRVNKLLQIAYDDLDNTRVIETIEQYRKQDPSVVPNEMHSILGSEVRDLPVELEIYYRRYFTDRSKIVDFSEQYEQAFIDRKNQIRDYDAQLASLKVQIERDSQRLSSTQQELSSLKSTMNQYSSSGQTQKYNELVPVYNQKVNAYNSLIDATTADIAKYNDIVQQRNAVVSEEVELVEAIDSRKIIPSRQ